MGGNIDSPDVNDDMLDVDPGVYAGVYVPWAALGGVATYGAAMYGLGVYGLDEYSPMPP